MGIFKKEKKMKIKNIFILKSVIACGPNPALSRRYFGQETFCSPDQQCPNGQFCNYDSQDYGFCERCIDFPSRHRCATEGFITKRGNIACMSTCFPFQPMLDIMNPNFAETNQESQSTNQRPGFCSENDSCPAGWLCNFDNGSDGFCENCDNFATQHSCAIESFITTKGNVACMDSCFPDEPNQPVLNPGRHETEPQPKNTENVPGTCPTEPCPEGWFCNYDSNYYGFCENCAHFPNQHRCATEGFITKRGNVACMDTCYPNEENLPV